jgi:hypothetical protein
MATQEQENMESFVIVRLDSNNDDIVAHTKRKARIRDTINYLKMYDNVDEGIKYHE